MYSFEYLNGWAASANSGCWSGTAWPLGMPLTSRMTDEYETWPWDDGVASSEAGAFAPPAALVNERARDEFCIHEGPKCISV